MFSALEPVTLELLRSSDHRWGPVRLVGAGFGSWYLNPSLAVGCPNLSHEPPEQDYRVRRLQPLCLILPLY